jgi:hypothetical protein
MIGIWSSLETYMLLALLGSTRDVVVFKHETGLAQLSFETPSVAINHQIQFQNIFFALRPGKSDLRSYSDFFFSCLSICKER